MDTKVVFDDLSDWESNLELSVNEFYADYAGCGSHQIALHIRMDASNIKALRDRCNRILEGFEEGNMGLLTRKEVELNLGDSDT
jgi:hypothetical protein